MSKSLIQQYLPALPDQIKITGEIEDRFIMVNDDVLQPDYSQKIRNHSPDGFNWGYGGSGPSQLSLAIMMKYLPIDLALEVYHDFKFNVIALWPRENFNVTVNLKQEIQKIINAQ